MTFFRLLGNSFIYNAIYKLEKTKIIYKIYFFTIFTTFYLSNE